ncbi:hypothetical protein NKH77_19665 [Streptomyces sp. M19]
MGPHLSVDPVARGVIGTAVAYDGDAAPMAAPRASNARRSARTGATRPYRRGIR